MIRRPPRSTQSRSSAASDVYKRQTLRAMAAEAADKVIGYRKRQVLEPMSALERRIVHMALKDVNGVVTHSEGREPYRRIVISPSE